MPIYEYECKKCGKIFEVYRRLSEKDEDLKCPICGEERPKKRVSSVSSLGSSVHSESYTPSGSCGGGHSSGFG